MDYSNSSRELHKKFKGKLATISKVPLASRDDLSNAYTPGVATPCLDIEKDKALVYEYTMKANSVAVITDGSAVLGLGNIGAEASIPVMEGKCVLFKEFADIDAFPLALTTQDIQEIINIVKNVAPVFGGINLEDIAAPKCFEIEEALQDIGIPVMHDDQHGTAVVLLAALINSAKLAGKKLSDLRVVVSGAGAAGTAIAKILTGKSGLLPDLPVADVILCDTKGAISKDRTDLNDAKKKLLEFSNKSNLSGSLSEVIKSYDVFIGVSAPNTLTGEMIRSMNEKPIIFAMANPTPEIMPVDAREAGAFIVGTGRSDFPNQINNVLAYPGIFRGALDARAKKITTEMKIAAALALANHVTPSVNQILPEALDRNVAQAVAKAVANASD